MQRNLVGSAIFFGALVAGCTDATSESNPDPDPPSPFDSTEQFASSNYEVLVDIHGGPADIETQPANNNLDVATFQGRTFLAWRSAPTHFASADTELLLASEGPEGWRFEGRFAIGTDLREPRLLALDDRLFLYFAVLGADPLAFEPQGTMVTEYHGPGMWDEPQALPDLPTFIVWRARAIGGTAYLVGYDGGSNIYQFNGDPIHVRFFTTSDGRTLEPVWPDHPILLEGGSSETDFAFLDDGDLLTVSRNEAGDDVHGFGSVICRTKPASTAAPICKTDPRKFDSPLVIARGKDIWLVGRRNATESGNYDLGYGLLPLEAQAGAYETAYSLTPKRCALWRVDPADLTVEWIQDLPSRGDTCFPAATERPGGGVTIYNYTSPLEDALDCAQWPDECSDPPWGEGQLLPTNIVRLDVALP